MLGKQEGNEEQKCSVLAQEQHTAGQGAHRHDIPHTAATAASLVEEEHSGPQTENQDEASGEYQTEPWTEDQSWAHSLANSSSSDVETVAVKKAEAC